jgi:hypothetical protein
MVAAIRKARLDDVPAMVELAEQKRLMYQEFQPIFWKKADNSPEAHASFLEHQVGDEQFIALVHEQDGIVDGFLIARLVPNPPVYNSGLTGSIDDFWVTDGKDWEGVGLALLNAAIPEMKQRDATQLVVVCGHKDQAKRTMLQKHGYTIASEWYFTKI